MIDAFLANDVFMRAQCHSFTLTCHHEGIRDSQKRKVLVERQVLRRTEFEVIRAEV
jgi:hypothetical protein